MGRHVSMALAHAGNTVLALDKFKPNDTSHVREWHETDSHDLNYLKQAAEGCDTAVFLGGTAARETASAPLWNPCRKSLSTRCMSPKPAPM